VVVAQVDIMVKLMKIVDVEDTSQPPMLTVGMVSTAVVVVVLAVE
jgi:hypothetical protein